MGVFYLEELKMEEIFTAKNICYTYRDGKRQVEALKGVDLHVNRGEIFGFIGPNGAGKTTTIKLLLGILIPQKGEISVFGKPPFHPETRKTIGYMPEIAYYYKYLTPVELLDMYGDIFGIEKKLLRERIKKLLELVDLTEASNRLMRTFSKGMMQKVSFAQALINDPDLLILDEPTGGLDPVARKKMREVIQDLRSKGKTVFFSSHELSEVELISDRIAILHKGNLLGTGPVKELLGGKEEGQTLESYFLKMIGEKA
jgi:ABC-2 type transport system ATP-binding protein